MLHINSVEIRPMFESYFDFLLNGHLFRGYPYAYFDVLDSFCWVIHQTCYIKDQTAEYLDTCTPLPHSKGECSTSVEKINKVMHTFSKAKDNPTSLLKLCILKIRQGMISLRMANFDCLPIPGYLKSLVTQEYMLEYIMLHWDMSSSQPKGVSTMFDFDPK